jgi:hypothetical protein
MNKNHLINGYHEWLSRYRWTWFGTLTFRSRSIPLWRTDRCFEDWIYEIDAAVGAEDFRWFRVTEFGAFKDNLHYHVLVGGLKDPCKWPWILRWQELAGDADIFYFIRSMGGIRYMLKTADPNTDFEIKYDL